MKGRITIAILTPAMLFSLLQVNAAAMMKRPDYAMISAENGHVLAVKDDGSLWGWGSNAGFPLIRPGSAALTLAPIKIMDDILMAATGY